METLRGSSTTTTTASLLASVAVAAGVIAGTSLYGLRAARRRSSGMTGEGDEGDDKSSSSSVSPPSRSGLQCCGGAGGSVTVTLPPWASNLDSLYSCTYRADDEMMDVAVSLSARNVSEGTGGPFGAAVFARNVRTGEATLVSVGVNRVVPLGNSTLHGETVAIQLAQSRIGSYTLRGSAGPSKDASGDDDDVGRDGEEEKKEDFPATIDGGGGGAIQYELFTSCEPCAMCLGATLWSGVSRLVCAARKEDAAAIGFDEGPVFPESYEHLRSAGVEVVFEVRTREAAAVLEEYGRGGVIYNR